MPLPEEGNAIGFDDINEELGNSSNAELDLESASELFGLTSPHGMNELFGLSLDNFATSLSISPTSITSADKGGQTSTITYTSDGNFKINDENISFATVALGSGSEGTDNTFDIVIQAQPLDGTSRSGNITLESPDLTNITLTVQQEDNDATLTIVRQTGVMTFGHGGGEGEHYKIETDPEGVVTWVASISGESGFSHRIYNSGNSFSTSNISGTGDEFIEVKSDSNSTSSDKTATVTVDPDNISDANVTDTVRVQREPTFSVAGTNLIGGVHYSTSNFVYTDSSYTDRITFTVTSNYNISTISDDSTSFTSTKESNSTFYVYPSSNSSTSTRSVNVTVTLDSIDSSTHTVQVSQGGAPAATANITDPAEWNYNQSGTSVAKTVTGTAGNYNSGGITFTLGNTSEWRFVDTYQTSTYTYQYVEMGGSIVANQASVTSPSSGTYQAYVYPVSNNTDTSNKTRTLTFNAGGASDTTTLTQLFQTVWTASPSSLSFIQGGETENITLETSYTWTATVSGTGFSLSATSGVAGTHTIGVTATSNSGGVRTGTVTISATGETDHTISLSQAGAPLDFDWFTGGSSTPISGTSITLSPTTSQTTYSFGLYAYRNSTADAQDWSITRTTGGTFATVSTSNSVGSSTQSQTTTQSTNGTPYLYVYVEANTSSSSRTATFDLEDDSQTFTRVITINQAGVSGGGDRPDPGDQI